MENKKRLIYAEDAKQAIGHADPAFRDYIDNVPTADAAEVKHGHWIDHYTNIICSECRAEYSDEIIFMNRDFEYSALLYCPNCGAKMDGERKGND